MFLFSENPDKDTSVSENLQKSSILSSFLAEKGRNITQTTTFIWIFFKIRLLLRGNMTI
jgi:hypothetical protein